MKLARVSKQTARFFSPMSFIFRYNFQNYFYPVGCWGSILSPVELFPIPDSNLSLHSYFLHLLHSLFLFIRCPMNSVWQKKRNAIIFFCQLWPDLDRLEKHVSIWIQMHKSMFQHQWWCRSLFWTCHYCNFLWTPCTNQRNGMFGYLANYVMMRDHLFQSHTQLSSSDIYWTKEMFSSVIAEICGPSRNMSPRETGWNLNLMNQL